MEPKDYIIVGINGDYAMFGSWTGRRRHPSPLPWCFCRRAWIWAGVCACADGNIHGNNSPVKMTDFTLYLTPSVCFLTNYFIFQKTY